MMSFNNTRTLTHSEQQQDMDALTHSKKRPMQSSSDGEDEEKRERRRVANRKASVACRLRKKIFITELQRQVSELSRRNNEIEEENAILRRMFQAKVAAEQQQANLKSSQQIGNGANMRSLAVAGPLDARTLSHSPAVTMSPSPSGTGSTSQSTAPNGSREDFYAELVKNALAEFQQQRREEQQKRGCKV